MKGGPKALGTAGPTLLVAALGGALAAFLGLPVPWLLGSAFAVSLASIAGFATGVPHRLRDVAFFILGIQAGSGVTPEVLEQLAILPMSFAIQMLGIVAVIAVTFLFLNRAFGWDRETALFASIPGALSFVIAAASETRADMAKVTVVQSVRLLFLIGALTPALVWLESGGTGAAAPAAVHSATLAEYALLVGASLLGAAVGQVTRVPGGMMLGTLIASGLMHGTGLAPATVPQPIALCGLVVVGALVGSRLNGISRRDLLRLLPASLGGFVIGIAVTALFGLLAVALLGVGFGEVALAYGPGALEAMTVLAYQFRLDTAYVAAHHVVRFMAIALLVPFLARRVPPPGKAGIAPEAEGSGVDGRENGR